jgi:serine protease Do
MDNLDRLNDVVIAPGPPANFEFHGNGFAFTGRPKLGLSIQDTDDGKGVKVLDVDEDSNAAKAGLREDDIIVGIDDKEVKSTDDVTRTIRENRDKYTFNFKVLREGKTQNIEVKMPRKLKTTDL